MKHVDLTQSAIVVSMSDFARFKRCRKAADLTYHHGLEPLADKDVMARGREFHAELEAFAISQVLTVRDDPFIYQRLSKLRKALAASDLAMVAVAEQYINRRWNIEPSCIMSIEEPVYTLLLPRGAAWNGKHDAVPSPAVYLRTTFDLIYKDTDAWITGREYKTFERAATYDNDLDFQGKIEMAVMQHQYHTRHARFEYHNVRQTPPDVKKDKAGNCWREDECYIVQDFYPSDYELASIWGETQAVARDLLGCLASDDPFVWYRVDLKGSSPHTCHTCFVKDLCKDEAMFGGLSGDTIAQYAKPREYVDTTVDGHTLLAEKPREFTPFHAPEVHA